MIDESAYEAIKPGHGDDLFYLFDPYIYALSSENDLKMSDMMMKYWTNFAKHHNPSPPGSSDDLPQWLTYSSEKVSFLCLKLQNCNDFQNTKLESPSGI